ncbi:MAG: hypothetical protein ABL949_11210 [Fimbriimonadaceae bacterium]
MAELEAASGAFGTAYSAVVTAKAAARGAVSKKDTQRAKSEATYRKFSKIFLANPALTPELLSDLGMKVNPAPSGPVVPVQNLSAVGTSDGVNTLNWKRNGNANGTVFSIAAQIGGSATWTVIGSTTKVRYAHTGVTPSVQMIYRVTAQRGNSVGKPSNTAIVYGQADPGVALKLAA